MTRDRDAEIVAVTEQINELLGQLSVTVDALQRVLTSTDVAGDDTKESADGRR